LLLFCQKFRLLKFKVKIKAMCKIFLLVFSILGVIASFPSVIDGISNNLDFEEKFTIIVLPDTQYYSKSYPWIFENQTKWIVANKESMNIVFVSHLGDLVDHYQNIEEWDSANSSMSKLIGALPFGVLPGNHDGAETDGDLTNYNNYFGFQRFNNESWYGGAYNNINTNNYQLFSAGGKDYLIFHIQFNPLDEILSWANDVIDQHPNRRIIITTHDYFHGYYYYSYSRSEIAAQLWEKLKHQAVPQ
jgi:hypothetical protein